jgi:hypothetical protein
MELFSYTYRNTIFSSILRTCANKYFLHIFFFQCSSPKYFKAIKSRRMRWARHVAGMGEGRGVYRVLVGRPEGKRPLGRPRHRWEDNIKMDLREIGIDGENWIQLAQDRLQWRTCVNTVMSLRVP